ncbi:LCCL domain-containing protein [Coniella lustricola]|uniref:LCCL domain-containing protein n=1 Tax=Coniella lustricola TaxID=2025994 RepID=A0A2T2ZY31_9PEZI|nr:LCCL domain-containing protein [Coniella lustricola]
MESKQASSKRSVPMRRRNILYLGLLWATWTIAFKILSHESLPPIQSVSAPNVLRVKKLSCTDSLWVPEECGMDGAKCEPFENHHVAFQCPANCLRDGVVTKEPHLTGSQEIINRTLVIGGPIYRGDSYICPSAIHDGVIDEATGGCGVAKLMGMTNSFSSSYMYNVESLDVQTYFPMSFRFTIDSKEMSCPTTTGTNTQWTVPYVSAAYTALVWKTSSSGTVRTLWSLAVAYAHLSTSSGTAASHWWRQPAASSQKPRPADAEVPIPKLLEPIIHMNSISNFTIQWATPVPENVDGISMLVDDVERARRFFRDPAKNNLRYGETDDSFFWQRTPQAFVDYIRFGYIKDGKVLKYSKPGVWFTNGTWTGVPAET